MRRLRQEAWNMDLSSRDYDIKNIGEEDKRLKDCKREGLFIQFLAIGITFAGIILAYVLSPTREEIEAGANIPSLLGYPLWVLIPAALFLLQAVIMIIMAAKVFKRPSLAARDPEADGMQEREEADHGV